MAQVSFKKGPLNALPNTFSEGSFYVATDHPSIYLDVSNSGRIKLSDFTIVDKMSDLPLTKEACVTKFYFVNDDNTFATWSDKMDAMVKINIDTGATAAHLSDTVNSGNAVTNITYDSNNRAIIFEKGIAFVPQEQVGDLGDLTTVAKDTLVNAINEINAAMVEGTTGIKNMYMDEQGNLICVLTDDSQINVGKIPNYNDITLINCGSATE